MFFQVLLTESLAFCPKNHTISVAGEAAVPPAPYCSYAYAEQKAMISFLRSLFNDRETV